jgi:integrase
MQEIGRPQIPARLPVVLSRDEVQRLLAAASGVEDCIIRLLYGTGLRKMECLRLRVKDVDFDRGLVVVREGKGNKDRITMLPLALAPALREQLAHARSLWAADRAAGRPGVELPGALARKYPRAGESWGWFWVFPSDHESTDPRSAAAASPVRVVDPARDPARRGGRGIHKPVGAHTLRHSFKRTCSSAGRTSARSRNCSATRRQTMIYTHVLNRRRRRALAARFAALRRTFCLPFRSVLYTLTAYFHPLLLARLLRSIEAAR